MTDNEESNIDYAYIAYSAPGDEGYRVFKGHYDYGSFDELQLDQADYLLSSFFKKEGHSFSIRFVEELDSVHNIPLVLPDQKHRSTNQADYLDTARKLIDQLKEGNPEKLVYSCVDWVSHQGLDVSKLFLTLLERYQSAYIYLFYIPNSCCWIGASPEIILTREGDGYKTVALAGTQALNKPIEEISWGDKEVNEHRFIESYLDDSFSQHGISYEKSQAYTSSAGAMCHIKSDFNFTSDKSLNQLLDIIHPGPAISGYPVGIAMEFIKKLELHDRKLYAGIVGNLNQNMGKLQLYANLRCMQVFESGVLLYLGGGFTKNSDPMLEWAETRLKSTTMLSAMQSLM